MASHNAMTNWGKSDRYEDGWFIGSEGENGEHLQDASGWPFSVYRKAAQIGVSDAVLCHGIQMFDDALAIANALVLRTRLRGE